MTNTARIASALLALVAFVGGLSAVDGHTAARPTTSAVATKTVTCVDNGELSLPASAYDLHVCRFGV